MTHSMTDDLAKANEQNDSIGIVHVDSEDDAATPIEVIPGERYRRDLWPRAKPEERLTHGMRPEDFFGICAEEFDDEFMESLRAIRRGVWSTGLRS
jgi:hypothetical protein